jgi:hypothetical protein
MKETLTNEKLRNRFPNLFELVDYAIDLVDNMVQSGRGPRVRINNENPAVIVLEEISEGKDVIDPLPAAPVAVETLSVYSTTQSFDDESEAVKQPEKKVKARRIVH